ncbi:MAG: tetratricopeptide repeat protein [Bacteroidota bacterium]
MEDYPNIERIDRYLNAQMQESEKAAFETELDTNPSLKQEFSLFLSTEAILLEKGRGKELQYLSERYYSNKSVSINKSVIIITLSSAAIISLLVWFFWPSPQSSYQELYTNNYDTPTFRESKSIVNQDSDSLLNLASVALRQENYKKAESHLLTLLENNKLEDTNYYHKLLGHTYMELGEFAQAIEQYQATNLSDQTVDWYLALAWIKLENKAEAIKMLNKTRHYSFYADRSERLLKILDRFP